MIKDIKGYEGRYQITDDGKVWSCLTNRYLKPKADKDGYFIVCLMDAIGKRHYERVHRLVALMYCEKQEGCNVVNHIDSNRQNNHYSNLEWTTVKGNTIHGYIYGSVAEAQKKATEAARIKNTKTILIYKNNRILCEAYGLNEAAEIAQCNEKTIRNCIKEKRSSKSGYRFEYKEGDQSAADTVKDQ